MMTEGISTMAAADTAIARVGSGKRSQRMVAVLDLVAEHGAIGLAELCDALRISPATARRDLAVLAEQKLLLRTHGGATILDHGTELPVALRDTRFQEAKRRIARTTAELLPQGRHAVALSGGTTTASVARELVRHPDLTIVTNSLTIAGLVANHPQLKVVMTGGILRPQSLELVGVLAEGTFTAVNVGTAILGADGISAASGVTTHDETEARTNHAMVMKAQRTIVVADGSKIGRVALARMADLGQVAVLVTDSSADAAELERIRAAGVEVVVVAD